MNAKLCELLDLEFPIIVAPMFLVSNTKMLIAAGNSGITGAIPALNFRSPELLRAGLKEVKAGTKGKIGVNLIVNKSNIKMTEQLKVCLDEGVDYFITSLGSPKEVIEEAHKNAALVFCDVVDKVYAKKVEDLGADALIAVNKGAGGHAGNIPASILIPDLVESSPLPVISAGGVATGSGILSMLSLGAAGLSMGTPFIACEESDITEEYKQAMVDYGAKDIVMTAKLSGTPCTVVNSDYVKKIGTEQNPLEKYLNQNRQLKKYAKMITGYKGMKLLEKAAFSATYKSIWCAGPSLEFTRKIEKMEDIVLRYLQEYKKAREDLAKVW